MKTAIIGAGMAGLTCASRLQDAGMNVTVFEKSRGTGGRLATRRSAVGGFDHGAQFVTARDPAFRSYLESAMASGRTSRWETDASGDETWWTGTPGMSGLVKPMADALDVQTGQRAVALASEGEGWSVQFEGGAAQNFQYVLLAVPVVQAIALLGDHAASFPGLDQVEIAPCWTGMFAFKEAVPGEAAVIQRRGDLAWATRENTRPGRAGELERWVVQASADWSRAKLEETPDTVMPSLLDLFGKAVGQAVSEPVHADVHRWRYAKVEKALGEPCLWDSDLGLGLAGDWCMAARVEAAFLSGRALADQVLATQGH